MEIPTPGPNKFVKAGVRALFWAVIMFVYMALGTIYESHIYTQDQRMNVGLAAGLAGAIYGFVVTYCYALLREYLKEKGGGPSYQSVRAIGGLCGIIILLSTTAKLFSVGELTDIEKWTESREQSVMLSCYGTAMQQDPIEKEAGLSDGQIGGFNYDYCSCFVKSVKGRFGYGEYARDQQRAIAALNSDLTLSSCVLSAREKNFPASSVVRLGIPLARQASVELNKTLPQMVDQVTRFDSASPGSGSEIIYNYTIVPVSSKNANSAHFADYATWLQQTKCAHSDKNILLASGVTEVYIYHGNDGGEIVRVPISAKGCASLPKATPSSVALNTGKDKASVVPSAKQAEEISRRSLESSVEAERKTLPRNIAEGIREDTVEVTGSNEVTLGYTLLAYDAGEVDASLLNSPKKILAACEQIKPEKTGIAYVFKYRGKDGVPITSIKFDAKKCSAAR